MSDPKRATVSDPPVGAGGRQSHMQKHTSTVSNSIDEVKVDFAQLEREFQRITNPDFLPTVTLEELYDTAYPVAPPVVDEFLFPGLYLLAGAPKVGKSFLAAQIAYCVSSGTPLWQYQTRQSTVLYLALEDSHKRLQARMARMFDLASTVNLHFSVSAKQLTGGLLEQLAAFLEVYPDTRLIIIDTFQTIRGFSGESYSYGSDYEAIGCLKRFADQHQLCLVVVHHTRKQRADDRFEQISGTTGLLGCADGAFLLQKDLRTGLQATLDVVGRDQPDQRLHLRRDPVRLTWALEAVDTEPWALPPDPLLARIAALAVDEWVGSPTDLVVATETDLSANALSRYLNVSAPRLLSEHGIAYTHRRTSHGRKISLQRVDTPS